MFVPGHLEIVVILFVVFLLFGHRFPVAARSIAKSIVSFRRGLREKTLR